MKVLGIDPGLANCGYGVVEEKNSRFLTVVFGTIKTQKNLPQEKRFLVLFEKISEVLKNYQPDAVSLETLFFNKNSKTAFLVGRASGVVILAAGRQKIPVFEYTPPQVKAALTGSGIADKTQIQKMVKILLGVKTDFETDDVADALAIAICHLQNAKFKQKVGQAK